MRYTKSSYELDTSNSLIIQHKPYSQYKVNKFIM